VSGGKRALQAALAHLEEFLLDLLAEVRGERPLRRGHLFAEEDPLPEDPRLEAMTTGLLGRVEGLGERLGLPRSLRSRRRARLAQVALLWSELEGVRPEGLRRYGPLEGELLGIGEEVEALCQGLLRLSERMEERRVEDVPQDPGGVRRF
jgi:hypothetical protein